MFQANLVLMCNINKDQLDFFLFYTETLIL